MATGLRSIVAKLNDTMRATLEGAAGLCLARTHYDVEIEHVLTKLLDTSGTDFAGIVQHFSVDKARLSGELARSLDKLKSGNARTPAFSPSLVRMLREAWTVGSLEFGAGQVRSGTAILALVSDDELSRLVLDVSKEFRKIEPEALRKMLPAILADSREVASEADAGAASGAGSAGAAKAGGKDIAVGAAKTAAGAAPADAAALAEQENRARRICVTQGGGNSRSYTIAGNAGPMKVTGTACSLAKPFTVKGSGGGMTVTFSYAPSSETGGKVSYTGGGPGALMAGAGTYTVTLDGKGGTIKQTHTGKVQIPFGGSATHTDILRLTPIPPC